MGRLRKTRITAALDELLFSKCKALDMMCCLKLWRCMETGKARPVTVFQNYDKISREWGRARQGLVPDFKL